MKPFSLLITSLLLVSSLNARENPFMPTKAYEDEVSRLMEIDENFATEFQENSQNIEKEDMTPVLKDADVNKVHKNAIAKTEKQINVQSNKNAKKEKAMQEALEKVAMQKKQAEKKNLEETLLKAKALEEKGPMIYIKMREDVVVDQKLELLPFINIEYTNTKLTLTSKYKVFKKFYLEEENKLILDYKADTKFFTKRENLEAKYFQKIIIGNHKKEKFFRVVLILNESPIKYSVTYNNDSVYIIFNEEMAQ